ncbi:ABC transporter ATP-binding protein [Deinococcus maricopensis]|uniref:Xenobiotic-transporting ATPase n=1 Tax=Deinococcus maricopensis (strain DSM 21211 / LMG 22137 / NRRL B-23946 / LB-34) TaxID=709986 RepID=E8U6E0_DEIML|nr:ABC transporter ATP-binding protein [Deinococcus maricopensis]ADV66629.1 Xenobiotic-transporting ATPase [Deinococcus maricopensis DSM 21211]
MMMPPRPVKLPPGERVTLAMLRADLLHTLRLVWAASPRHSVTYALTTLAGSALPAANLYVGKLLLDGVARAAGGGITYSALLGLLAVQVALVVLGSLLSTVQNASQQLLGDSLQHSVTRRILEKASGLSVDAFENADTYDRLQQAYREVGSRPLGVATQLVSLAGALVTLGSVGVLMSRLGVWVLPLVLLASLPGVIVSNRFGVEGYRMLRRQTHDARVQNYLGSLLTSDSLVKEVRLFQFEPYLLTRWRSYYLGFRVQLEQLVRQRSAWGFAAALASALLIGVASALILARAARGQITVGDFSVFVLGIAQVQGTVAGLLSGVSGIYQNLLYMRNLFSFLELPARDLDAGEPWRGPIDTIEFREVSFRYPLTERDVLRGVSFTVRRGQALALVGENGAGKTTIVKLLTRLFEPTGGQVLINGQDAARFSPRSVQREMSIIFQDFGQYQMSARENVALAEVSRLEDAEGVQSAVDRAGAAFVEGLPQGLETPLGRLFQGGRQLSGGQWQRLALARLYFRDASVLVFDEPTAALDARAEFETMEALRAQARDRLTLLISHRFSTVRLADDILVLDGGVVSEAGSHEALMALGGTYAKLYALQASGYAPRGASAEEDTPRM